MTVIEKKRNILYLAMFLSSVSFFSFFPYLSMLLKESYALSYWQIGGLVGSIALISSCGSWLGGYLADRWHCKSQIQSANFLFSLSLLGIYYVENITTVVVSILLLGCARLLFEPAIKKELLSVDDGSGQVFRMRYLALIIGAIVGPVLSGMLTLWSAKAGFLLAALLYLTCLLAIAFGVPVSPVPKSSRLRTQTTINVRPIIVLILIGLLFFLGISQLTTTIPIYLNDLYGSQSEYVYRALLMTNAVLAALLTFNIDRIKTFSSQTGQVIVASTALALSFVVLIFVDKAIWMLGLTVVLYTFAEVVLFPLPDTMATKYSGNADHGFALGLLDLRYIAFFLGPLTGGYLLGKSATTLFLATAVAMLFISPLYLLLSKNRYPQSPSPMNRAAI